LVTLHPPTHRNSAITNGSMSEFLPPGRAVPPFLFRLYLERMQAIASIPEIS
jgi:hypothetical protein